MLIYPLFATTDPRYICKQPSLVSDKPLQLPFVIKSVQPESIFHCRHARHSIQKSALVIKCPYGCLYHMESLLFNISCLSEKED